MKEASQKKKEQEERRLTLLGHLEEIRQRLTWSVVALVVGIVVSFIFAGHIFDFFISRAPSDVQFIFTEPAEMMGTYMKVCLYAGLVLAMPFVVYQMVMFVRPALTRKERGYLYLLLPAVMFFFFVGAGFAYFVFMPRALDFLLGASFLPDVAEPMIKIGSYISFLARMIFWLGVVFELPVIIFFLAKIGVVNHQWMQKNLKWAFVGAFILGAIITPTPDPINQTIVAGPIFILYVVSIGLAWVARRPKKEPLAETESQE
jgi:sec-independent protein translocase protein TatC